MEYMAGRTRLWAGQLNIIFVGVCIIIIVEYSRMDVVYSLGFFTLFAVFSAANCANETSK